MRSARFGFADGVGTLGWAVGVLGLSTGMAAAAGADPIVDPVTVAVTEPSVDPVAVAAATDPVGNPGIAATANAATGSVTLAIADPVAIPVAAMSGDAARGDADAAVGMPMPMPMPMSIDTTTGLTLSIGGSYLGGDFGTPTDSEVAVVLGNARYRRGDVRVNATLPWMQVRSDAAIYTGIDGSPLVVAPSQSTGRRKRHGFGDLTLGGSWLALRDDAVGADVELSGRIKIPTASDGSGLSTGKVDYAVAAEVSRTLGIVTPSLRLGYRFLGDFDGMDLRNGFTSSIGASFLLFTDSVALISYDYTQRASTFIGDAHEISLGLSTPLGGRFRLNSYGSIGLSSGAPDVSAGLSLTVGLGS